jgi:hypothetical protein
MKKNVCRSIAGCLLAIASLQCVTVRVISGINENQWSGFCENSPSKIPSKIPVRLNVTYKESAAFSIAHRDTFDNTDIERKAKRKIEGFIIDQIEASDRFRISKDAEHSIEIVLLLMDTSDRYDSDSQNLTGALSCITFLVFPYRLTYEDNFEIKVSGSKPLVSLNYAFGREEYFGWLLIPFNIFVVPFHGNLASLYYNIDFHEAFREITPKLQKDLKAVACRIQKEEESKQFEFHL